MGKKKKPDRKFNPNPLKRPATNPDFLNFENSYPVWRLGKMDFDGPFGWNKISKTEILRVHQCLADLEKKTWDEIKGKLNHSIKINQLSKKARKRLTEKQEEDIDRLFSIHVTSKYRIIGILDRSYFHLLWWDPKHGVCPSVKKHT
jgi:plasmid maintenance system killer protein